MGRLTPEPGTAQVSRSQGLGANQGTLFIWHEGDRPRESPDEASLTEGSPVHERLSTSHADPSPHHADPQKPYSPDPARERRVKALTCTEPLHALQANRTRRGWDQFDFYDLGLAAIDAVVDKMGLIRASVEKHSMRSSPSKPRASLRRCATRISHRLSASWLKP